jgi:hypothetical protein
MEEKQSKAKYPKTLFSRCSEEDFQRVEHAAAVAGLSLCAYVRARATGAHITAKTDTQTFNEIRRIGRMLKRMWSEGHDTTAALNELRQTMDELRKRI